MIPLINDWPGLVLSKLADIRAAEQCAKKPEESASSKPCHSSAAFIKDLFKREKTLFTTFPMAYMIHVCAACLMCYVQSVCSISILYVGSSLNYML